MITFAYQRPGRSPQHSDCPRSCASQPGCPILTTSTQSATANRQICLVRSVYVASKLANLKRLCGIDRDCIASDSAGRGSRTDSDGVRYGLRKAHGHKTSPVSLEYSPTAHSVQIEDPACDAQPSNHPSCSSGNTASRQARKERCSSPVSAEYSPTLHCLQTLKPAMQSASISESAPPYLSSKYIATAKTP